jgi:FkbM family methyltransferase
MKSSTQFFTEYYLKKHIGFLWGASIKAPDVFWKNFFRLKAASPIKVLKDDIDCLLIESEINSNPFTCYVRKAPSSDIFVYRQIFQNFEYLSLINQIKKNDNVNEVHLIIDAGANVGYTSIFFKHYFSEAMVIAIEPDELNAKQIALNFTANKIKNAEIVVAGVWSHECFLELKKDKSSGQEWGFYVEESKVPTGLKAIDILQLQPIKNGSLIDILKIDIEGSEATLFENKEKISKLLAITRYLAIEIHDDIADRRYIEQVLQENNFSCFNEGELTIASNLSLIKR